MPPHTRDLLSLSHFRWTVTIMFFNILFRCVYIFFLRSLQMVHFHCSSQRPFGQFPGKCSCFLWKGFKNPQHATYPPQTSNYIVSLMEHLAAKDLFYSCLDGGWNRTHKRVHMSPTNEYKCCSLLANSNILLSVYIEMHWSLGEIPVGNEYMNLLISMY